MSEWKQVTLGEVADLRNGINYTKENFGGGVRVINVKDFQDYLYPIYDTLEEINPEGVMRELHLLREGDLVFVRSNGNPELIGRSLQLQGIGGRLVTHSAFTIRARFTSTDVLPKYCAFIFRSPLYRKLVSQGGNGTNISNLNQQILSQLRIPLPDLPIQRKIAAILSAYDDLIENNTRRIALLEKMAEEVYREWFVRLRFPGRESVPVHGGVPEGWEKVPTGDAFEITGGGTPSKDEPRFWWDGDVNWFTPSDITAADGMFLSDSGVKCTVDGLANSSARLFPSYSIMMTSRATIGALGINTTPACTNQGFITCIPNEDFPLTYLYFWLKFNKSYFELLSTGSTFLEMIKSNFRKIEILKPPGAIVQAYRWSVDPFLRMLEALLYANLTLKLTRDILLSRLLSGKLDVEGLDIQFPPGMDGRDDGREV